MKPSKEVYIKEAVNQIPRLLSLIDRKKGSITYGCFDRYYWRYKMIDFASAYFQNAALSLALIYANEYPGNIYYKHSKIRDWSIAAMEFLSSTQNSDGSLNGSFPFIWSVAGVSFPTYNVSEAFLLLENEINNFSKESIIETLDKAGHWLLRSRDVNVINQESAALMALYNLYLITGDDKYKTGVNKKLRFISENQSTEGWFNEYGGGDIAYLTLVIDLLAKYHQKSGDRDVLDILEKALEFNSYFVHPNGTMGGEYSSRNPEFIVPSGYEILSERFPIALSIASSNRRALVRGQIIDPRSLDDTYFTWLLHTFFQAHDNCNQEIDSTYLLPFYKNSLYKYFPKSGYLVIKVDDFYIVVGATKGNVLRVYSCVGENNLLLSDCGFLGVLSDGMVISTQWLDYKNTIYLDEVNNKITSIGKFHKINEKQPTPLTMVASRIGFFIFSKLPSASDRILAILRNTFITAKSTMPIDFQREISYNNNLLYIEDILKFSDAYKFDYLNIGDKFSTIYGQSKELFQVQELSNMNPLPEANLAKFVNGKCTMSIFRVVDLIDRSVKYKISVDGKTIGGTFDYDHFDDERGDWEVL